MCPDNSPGNGVRCVQDLPWWILHNECVNVKINVYDWHFSGSAVTIVYVSKVRLLDWILNISTWYCIFVNITERPVDIFISEDISSCYVNYRTDISGLLSSSWGEKSIWYWEK